MKSLLAAAGGVTLLVGALLAAPLTANAAAPLAGTATPSGPINSGMLAAMQRDLHLTAAQAQARPADDHSQRVTELTLRARLGRHYGGAWLAQDGSLVVATTSAAQASVITSLGARADVVKRTAAQLDSARTTLDRHASKAGRAVHSWYVDPATNQVVVSADSTASARKFATAAGLGTATVRTVASSAAPKPMADVRGGDQFDKPVSGGYVLCSIGFSVNGGFITAGHCGATNDNVVAADGHTALGTYRGSTFPGNDYAWVQVNSGWTPQPWVNNYSGGNATVAGAQEAGIGAAVCRSGRTTGWRCGVIQAKNVTVNYSNGPVYGLTQSNACAEGGDSGGSWLAGDQAQGTTSGGSGNCTSGGTMFFQPINPTLSHYGLSLVTTGGSSSTSRIVGYGNRCIDVPGSNGADGQYLQMWDCNGTGAQNWTFAADGTLRALGKCMDVAWGSHDDGAVIQLATCSGNPAQQFVLSAAGDLVNPQANKCVDVNAWGNANGTRLIQWTCTGGANQKWHRA